MKYENFTPTPNIVFDQLLRELSNSELKILLIIIRQTNGWVNQKTGERKRRDRISHSQFIEKTGLSRRIISEVINSLSRKELIAITDYSGNDLNNARKRKGRTSIYYSHFLEHLRSTYANNDTDLCKNRHQPVQNMVHNKRNYIKIKTSKERRTDYVHIKAPLDERKLKWDSKIKDKSD